MTGDQNWQDHYFTASDGIRLYAREYGANQSDRVPVLCLSGLTRTSRDFHVIARHLANSRRVICPDYRGRGLSGHAADWQTYTPANELADCIALIDQLGINQVFVIGTSRGGIVAMLMAAMHRDRLAGAVLNDIGPVLERAGLVRIAQYVGQMPEFASWQDATAAVKSVNLGFESLSDDEWDYFARTVFADNDGRPVADYDANLQKTMLSSEQIEAGEVPHLWPAFDALAGLPVAALRGANSDLLSAGTLAEMTRRVPGLEAATIANRGHTPFLTESTAIEAVDRTLARADSTI